MNKKSQINKKREVSDVNELTSNSYYASQKNHEFNESEKQLYIQKEELANMKKSFNPTELQKKEDEELNTKNIEQEVILSLIRDNILKMYKNVGDTIQKSYGKDIVTSDMIDETLNKIYKLKIEDCYKIFHATLLELHPEIINKLVEKKVLEILDNKKTESKKTSI